jgi:hypothetical protein
MTLERGKYSKRISQRNASIPTDSKQITLVDLIGNEHHTPKVENTLPEVIDLSQPIPKPRRPLTQPLMVDLTAITSSNNSSPHNGIEDISTSKETLSHISGLQCQICMDKIQEPAATDCGHVFCYLCIQYALTASPKCPLCRKSLTRKKIHKLYI